MRICFISPKAYPLFNNNVKSTFGGSEVQLNLLAKNFARHKDLNIHFIVADYKQKDIEQYDNINVWKSLNFDNIIIKQIIDFYRVFKKINADVYIQRTLTIYSGIIAYYCKIKHKKFIYMVSHDRETDKTDKIYNKKFKGFLANLVYKYSTLIVVQNSYEYGNLKKKFPKSNIEILKKGFDFSVIKKTENKTYDCIWIGRCEKWKNPETFIKLATLNKDFKFLMICPSVLNNENYFEEVKKKSEQIKNLDFIDFAKNKNTYDFLSKSKLFCVTSAFEGDWPMTVLEAAATGLPIISYILNYDNLITKYNAGFCCKNNFDLMNDNLRTLLSDKNLYSRMSNNAFEFTKENHDIDTNAEKFLTLFS